MAVEVPADLEAVAYATVEEADEVAELRVGGSVWLGLDEEEKEAALATASRDIDSIEAIPGEVGSFIGDRADDDQPLEWPRTDTDYSEDAWPQVLVDATIELAFSYAPAIAAGGTDVLNPSVADGNIKREKTGPLETEWFAPRTTEATAIERLPPIVQRLLARLIRQPVSSNAWGSAVVTRAS